MASKQASFTENKMENPNIHQSCYQSPSNQITLKNFKFHLPDIEVIGREEEQAELRQLLKKHKRVIISGMDGIGKTSFAAHSSRKYSSEFIEHIIFIDAETPDTIKSSFCSLGFHPDIYTTSFKDIDIHIEDDLIYRVFDDAPTLVIFDNVTSYRIIKHYLPSKHKENFYTLITTQLTEFDSSFYIYTLPLLKEQSCMKLIENKFKEHWNSLKHQKAELKELIVKMKIHSLAIIHAVVYIREKYEQTKNYTIQNYLDDFETKFNSIELKYSEEQFNKSVYISLTMNMGLLKNDKDYGVEAETALYSMAYLNPSNIDADMLLPLFNSDIRDTVIAILKKYSLIDTILKNSVTHITIHRLVQKACQNKVDLYLKKGLTMAITSRNIEYHWNFLEPNIKHFKLCDFNDCYKESYSSGRCREKLVEALRAVNCDYCAVDDWTAAHYSAFECNEYMLNILKQKGQNFSEIYQNWTILHAACLNVNILTDILFIIKFQHNLNNQTKENNTALHILMKKHCTPFCGQCNQAQKLINAGCDTTLCNKVGDTAIELAAKFGHISVLQHLLLLPGADVIFNKHDCSVNKWAEENYVTLFRQTSSYGGEVRLWYERLSLEPLKSLEEVLKLLELKGQYIPNEVCLDIVKLFDKVPSAVRIAGAYVLRKNITNNFPDHLNTLPINTVFNVQESVFGYRCYNISKLLCNIVVNLIKEQPLAFKIITFASCMDCRFSVEDLNELFDGKECLQNIRKSVELLENWSLLETDIKLHDFIIPDLVKPIVLYSVERGELRDACAAVITSRIISKGSAVRYLGCRSVREVYMEKYGNESDVIQSRLDDRCLSERLLNVGDLSQWSALHWAVYFREESVSEELLLLGASVNAVACDNLTPLHLAIIMYGNIKTLISNGALLTPTIQHDLTPLHISALSNYYHLQQIYYTGTKLDINVRMKDGRTPLHLAAARTDPKRLPRVKWCIDTGADVNICDNQGNTPAHIAASAGRPNTVALLRDRGADLDKCNFIGETPLSILSAKNLSVSGIK